MIRQFSKSQRELISDFFGNIAAAWFIAIFIDTKGNLLTLGLYGVSMIAALVIAVLLRKKEYDIYDKS